MEKQVYGNTKEILKYPENYGAVAVSLNATAFTPVDGVIPAGTLVSFDLENRAVKGVAADVDSPATGVLRYDVKVNSKEVQAAAVVIEGYVNLDRIPVAPTAEQVAQMKQITFLR